MAMAELDDASRATVVSMAFPRASMKREMMCRRLDYLRQVIQGGDIDSIQMVLGDFLMEARSLHDVIAREGRSLPGFSDWWAKRIAEVRADPLMQWAHEARSGDFHEGIPSVEVVGMEIHGGFEYDPEQQSDKKNQVIRNGGMFWYSEIGTPSERIERARIKADRLSVHIRIPSLSLHGGGPRTLEDVASLCERIARANQDLLHEVKVTFLAATLRPRNEGNRV